MKDEGPMVTFPDVKNPFGEVPEGAPIRGRADEARVEAEVMAMVGVSRRFPRSPAQSFAAVQQACARPELAEVALYAYPRGNEVVSGPSIRLAEALAHAWGNLSFGVRELGSKPAGTLVQAWAWDMENNVRDERTFSVRHERHTKRGVTVLTDPRDIYETVANQAARRKRAAILAVLPKEYVDGAVHQCELTLSTTGGAPYEQWERMAEAFEKLGVTREMVATRLRHGLQEVTVAEVAVLKRIHNSLRDGAARVDDFFTVPAPEPEADKPDLTTGAGLKAARKKREEGAEPPA